MNRKLKCEWIKALRSGEYKQCKWQLHNGRGFSCLGVLLDISQDGYWVPALEDVGNKNIREWAFEIRNRRFDPDAICELRDLLAISEDDLNYLVDMNDKGMRFLKIADWIEKNL